MQWDAVFNIFDLKEFLDPEFKLQDILKKFKLKKTEENLLKARKYLIKKNLAFLNREDFYLANTQDKSSYYILKTDFIVGKSFVIRPSKFEIDNGILILGSRFKWITSNEQMSFEPVINFGNILVEHGFFPMTYEQAKYYYYLENESEYINTIINQHSYNNENIQTMSPESTIKVSALNMYYIYHDLDFSYGDRLRFTFTYPSFRVLDISKKKEEPLTKKEEEDLQKIFDEQVPKICFGLQNEANQVNTISNLFFLENESLFADKQLSIEEMFLKSDTVSLIDYGYNGLIWINNFQEPFMKEWDIVIDRDDTEEEKFFLEDLKLPITNSIIVEIIKKFLYDSFANQKLDDEYFIKQLTDIFFPADLVSSEDQKKFFEIVQSNKEIIEKDFNPFAEEENRITVRNAILGLYFKVLSFTLKLISKKFTPSSFEGQEGIKLNYLLRRIVMMTEFYASNKYPYSVFFDSLDSLKSLEESFVMAKSSIEIQIQNMKI